MKIHKAFPFFYLLAAACSLSEREAFDTVYNLKVNECVQPGAAYLSTYTELNGDCGALNDEIITVSLDGYTRLPEGCHLGPGFRYSGCSVYVDTLCESYLEDGRLTTVTQTGKMDWNRDGSGGVGTISMSVSIQKTGSCRSTYRIDSTRL